MDSKKADNVRTLLAADIRYYRMLCMMLGAVIIVMACLLGWRLMHETTHIVPPEVRRPYEIGTHHTNKEYLLDMAAYVLDTILTVTPQSVDHHNTIILKMIHPDGYPSLKTFLDAASLRIRKEHITTIWVLERQAVEEKHKRVIMGGQVKTFIADRLISVRDKEFTVEFTTTLSGRLYVSKIEERVERDASGIAQH